MAEALYDYLAAIGNHPRLTPDEEIELSARALKGDQGAINQLVESNLLLVVSIAKKYNGCGVPLPDLVQEGNYGLIIAAQRYDGSTGNRFSTFATYWIRHYISRSLAADGRTIRIPAQMIELLNKIRKKSNELAIKNHREPTEKELAAALGIELSRVQAALELAEVTLSLDNPIDEDGETCVSDITPDPCFISAYDKLVDEDNKRVVDEVLDTLSPREADVIKRRFGIGYDKAMTLEEVGEYLGISKEWVRQIQDKALKKLRNPMRTKMLLEVYA